MGIGTAAAAAAAIGTGSGGGVGDRVRLETGGGTVDGKVVVRGVPSNT